MAPTHMVVMKSVKEKRKVIPKMCDVAIDHLNLMTTASVYMGINKPDFLEEWKVKINDKKNERMSARYHDRNWEILKTMTASLEILKWWARFATTNFYFLLVSR